MFRGFFMTLILSGILLESGATPVTEAQFKNPPPEFRPLVI